MLRKSLKHKPEVYQVQKTCIIYLYALLLIRANVSNPQFYVSGKRPMYVQIKQSKLVHFLASSDSETQQVTSKTSSLMWYFDENNNTKGRVILIFCSDLAGSIIDTTKVLIDYSLFSCHPRTTFEPQLVSERCCYLRMTFKCYDMLKLSCVIWDILIPKSKFQQRFN